MSQASDSTPKSNVVWMGAISCLIAIGLPISMTQPVPYEYSQSLTLFWTCLYLLALVGLICWRVRKGGLGPLGVFIYGGMVVLCAAELQLAVEFMRVHGVEFHLQASPLNSRLLAVKVALALSSSVVQFGIAALGGGICTAALFLPTQINNNPVGGNSPAVSPADQTLSPKPSTKNLAD